MKTLTVKVSETTFREITAAAQARGVPRSVILRERVEQPRKDDAPSIWSQMEDLVFDDPALPVDLASNKQHLLKRAQRGNY